MPAGRPVKYKTPEEMTDKIVSYFASLQDGFGNWVRPPTMSGLALALDMTREGIRHYKNKNSEFADTITRAKSICESYLEELMITSNNRNLKFIAINCYGWGDKAFSKSNDSIPADKAILEARERRRKELGLAGS